MKVEVLLNQADLGLNQLELAMLLFSAGGLCSQKKPIQANGLV